MSQLDLASFVLGASCSLAALGFYVAIRRGLRASLRRKQTRQRRAAAIERAERHDAYKARVRFVPSDEAAGEQDDSPRRRGV